MNTAELIDLASGERFPVEDEVTVGREGCDIVLDDELVSRRHAAIRVRASGLEIEDLGSRNGTSVNGDQVRAPRALQPGDIVEIGGARLQVEMKLTAAMTKAAPVMPAPSEAVAGPRGDVPSPESEPQPPAAAPMLPADAPAAAPAFVRGGSRTARVRGSAARRGSATAVSLAVIAATAAALIAYFADRGL